MQRVSAGVDNTWGGYKLMLSQGDMAEADRGWLELGSRGGLADRKWSPGRRLEKGPTRRVRPGLSGWRKRHLMRGLVLLVETRVRGSLRVT